MLVDSESDALHPTDTDTDDIEISGDGRFAVYGSGKANLVGGHSNGEFDVFRRGPLR